MFLLQFSFFHCHFYGVPSHGKHLANLILNTFLANENKDSIKSLNSTIEFPFWCSATKIFVFSLFVTMICLSQKKPSEFLFNIPKQVETLCNLLTPM